MGLKKMKDNMQPLSAGLSALLEVYLLSKETLHRMNILLHLCDIILPTSIKIVGEEEFCIIYESEERILAAIEENSFLDGDQRDLLRTCASLIKQVEIAMAKTREAPSKKIRDELLGILDLYLVVLQINFCNFLSNFSGNDLFVYLVHLSHGQTFL